MANAYHDQNSVPTLIASSNVDGQTPVRVYADPVTHRLLVDNTGGGGSTWYQDEVPSGTINGSNVTFTLAHTPTAVVFLFLNGQYQRSTVEYSITGTTITMAVAPQVGDELSANYS